MKIKLRFLIPFSLFAVMVVFLAIGLSLDPREVPSPLIDKPAPAFELPVLQNPAATFAPKDMLGQVWILNVWASWCTACRAEHQLVNRLAAQKVLPIVGLNYKDEARDAIGWLGQLGNPFLVSVSDLHGRAGLDWGVYGVPESFVIDKRGTIRYKQIGPITDEALQKTILPLVQKLKGENS
jgi:cytochrome c biogenesis protein CcmG, thiol:disulfide interchange protein DsbE